MRPLKRYGQNFLIDKNILAFIISRSQPSKQDCVLEIGPGHGVLTRAILTEGVACLHTIELDERLRPELEDLAKNNDALKLHFADAVKFDYATLEPFPDKVIANIPYNITTPLIWKLLQYPIKYYLFMLQKELALRLIAPPDTKERYPLGVAIEAMGQASIVKRVSRKSFRPAPEVDSALVEIVIEKNFDLMQDSSWSELLHKGFAHRRKTLRNNLGDVAGIYADKRAEDLTCEQWLDLYKTYKKSPCD